MMPVTDQIVEAAVQGGDIAVLLAVLVQLSGDEALLAPCRPFIKGPWDYTVDMPPELDAEIRSRLIETLARPHSASMPSPELVEKIMGTIVGETVPPEYVAMLSQDIGCSKPMSQGPALEPPPDFKVVVIGAGISGICAAVRLRQAGFTFEVFEKDDQVGGTWYENRYPGCGVDTPNHFYSFSFELNHRWSRYFAKRDEIYQYLRHCAEKYEILDRIRLESEVESAIYDERGNKWTVRVRNRAGISRDVEANAVIFAVGGLNRASWPDIPGVADFSGVKLHTAAWDPSTDLKGRRVALIGTGASAMQAGPAIAEDVEHLTIYQRSPQWVTPNPNYHREVPEGKKLALQHIPFYARWYRFQLFWGGADAVHGSLIVDPAWLHPSRSLNAKNEDMRQRLTQHIREVLADRPDLLAKVIPSYPPYGKRMLRDNHWYATLKRKNVELVTDPIERITEHGVVAGSIEGSAEVLIFATGFNTHESLAPIEVRGRAGKHIREVWGKDDPRAYLGVTVPQFPNMFILFGPNTILAHGGSAVFQTEAQVNYALHGLCALVGDRHSFMECRQDVHDAYNRRVDEAHSKMVWAHSGVRNWYRNKNGRVTMATPWRMVDYWAWLSKFNRGDYLWG
jgi:4-hydroxyacetophenone monooxygenase